MPWASDTLIVFHGTDDLSANAIRINRIDKTRFKPGTDFGPGFYVTTVLHQAQQWANQRVRRTPGNRTAEVLEFAVALDSVLALRHMTFVVDSPDYYAVIRHCPTNRSPPVSHRHPSGTNPRLIYDVIYSPVSLWPQNLVIADCDQIFFADPLMLPAPPPGSGVDNFNRPSQSVRPSGNSRFF